MWTFEKQNTITHWLGCRRGGYCCGGQSKSRRIPSFQGQNALEVKEQYWLITSN